MAGLIATARARGASDVHVDPEHGVALRLNTHIKPLDDVDITLNDVQAFLDDALDRPARARFDAIGLIDVTCDAAATGALRVHASHGRKGPRLAIRLLAGSIPEFRELGLPAAIASFVELRGGLVLITGPPNSGKSTTVASLINRLNQSRSIHIVVLETAIEHHHRWQNSVISQYEVGRDVSSLIEGVHGALRADPDVLVIAELRGADVVTAALQAAEAGHLVIAALHSPSGTVTTINRIVGLFSAEEQEPMRHRLADALRGIAALRLLPSRDRRGLRAAAEVLIVTDAIRRLVRDGATHQIRSLLSTSLKDGSQTLERHLNDLVAAGEIEIDAARAVANYPNEIAAADRGK